MTKNTAEKLEMLEDQIAACKGKGDKIKPIERDWLQWAEQRVIELQQAQL